MDSNDSVVSATTPLGIMAVVKPQPQLPPAANASFLDVVVDNNPAAAALPAEVLQDGTALVLTTFDAGIEDGFFGLGQKIGSAEGRPFKAAASAVDVSIVDVQSQNVQHMQLTDKPIYVRVTQVPPESNWVCAFLDEDGNWSTEGVRLATAEELTEVFSGSDSSGTWCATTHLSIFSAFVDILLDCTNANMLTEDGLKEILEREGWWARPPGLALWILLSSLLLLIAFGCITDMRVHDSGLWRDEYFLTDLPPKSRCWGLCGAPENHSDEARTKEQEGPKLTSQRSFQGKEPNGAKFTSQRSFLGAQGSFLSALQGQTAAFQVHQKLLKAAKPTLASRFSERFLCQSILWEVARRCRLHSGSLEMHVWGQRGWVQGSVATQKSTKLKEMVMTLDELLPEAFLAVQASRIRPFWTALLAAQPIYELSLCDLHMTAAKRAKIEMDCIVGSLSFVALFFSVDGTAVAARSPSECPIEQGTFLWYTFVAMFSVLISFVPRSLECYLARRSFVQESRAIPRPWQLWMRRGKNLGFWVFSTILSFLYLLVITAFLANLSEADEGKWMFSFGVVILRKMIIVPVLACLVSGIGTALASGLGSRSSPALPPKKFGLDLSLLSNGEVANEVAPSETAVTETWTEKVQELAGRGLTVRQLLEFYAMLGDEVMQHFSPEESTTHDVVRQAIIPLSRQIRGRRCFVVVVEHSVDVIEPVLEVSVLRGGEPRGASWKPTWKEAFLVEDLCLEDSLIFRVLDPKPFSVTLPATDVWQGFKGILGNRKLQVSVAAVRDSAHKVGNGSCVVDPSDVSLRGSSHSGSSIAEKVEIHSCRSGSDMLRFPEFNPDVSLPELDAIDGCSQEAQDGFAYASTVNNGLPCMPLKMVTHSWRNKFCFLLAAILADALNREKYDEIARLLAERQLGKLVQDLFRAGKLDVAYWVCAFSVNQHTGICATPPPTIGVTGQPSEEMNKFDDMMAYLKTYHRQHGGTDLRAPEALVASCRSHVAVALARYQPEARLEQVVALEKAVKMHSSASRDHCLDRLVHLDVSNAASPRESLFEDRANCAVMELVLSKITDVDAFNDDLQKPLALRAEETRNPPRGWDP
ncbi:unnamed protein product [Symbiodinium necroappetens]|uniref:GPS domain-containing protein n=1 Tax=Symbiodinium necroappetens TaxID=1628268 RepID=A0A812NR91_9DINO|nr:unnamed protein product [Symbiodinium necroappetens]